MGLIAVTGQPGCREESLARLVAQRLNFEVVTEARLGPLLEEEFGPILPGKAWASAVLVILARLATERHLVVCLPGAEFLARSFRNALRVLVVAPPATRVGSLMVDKQLDRQAARTELAARDADYFAERKRKFGRVALLAENFDLVVNAERLPLEAMAEMVVNAAQLRGLPDAGLLSTLAEAQIQFQARLKLSRFGIQPAGRAQLKPTAFVHPSEEIFANLLSFYQIPFEYEPRTFPIRWDEQGNVVEAFTPDFYLPEFDLFVELTTMKQSLVTKKNRKIKRLRELYPDINIQVFYEKDFRNLIFKYGLAMQPAQTS